jgi:hypothetical protein
MTFTVTLVVTLGAIGVWYGLKQVKGQEDTSLKALSGTPQRYSKEDLLLCNLISGVGTHYMLKVYDKSPEHTVKHFSLSYLSKLGLRNLHKALHKVPRKSPETVIINYLTDLTAI